METFVLTFIAAVVGFAGGWYTKGKFGVKAAAAITDIRK